MGPFNKKSEFPFPMKWQSGDCELAKIWQNVRQLWHQCHLNTGKWLGTKQNANGVEKKRGESV